MINLNRSIHYLKRLWNRGIMRIRLSEVVVACTLLYYICISPIETAYVMCCYAVALGLIIRTSAIRTLAFRIIITRLVGLFPNIFGKGVVYEICFLTDLFDLVPLKNKGNDNEIINIVCV